MTKRKDPIEQQQAPAGPEQDPIQDQVKATVAAELAALKTEIAGGITGLVQQIDDRIEKAVEARLNTVRDEIKAILQARAGQPAPAQPEAQGNGQQPASRANLVEALAPLLPLVQQLTQQPAINPIAQLTAQVGQLAELISAVDMIRGGAQAKSNMTPKTALEWAKWGHQLAKAGGPPPTFPSVSYEEPPAQET